MNWTGGARARASKASTGVVAKQKQYFARVRAKATADAFMGAPSSVGDIDPDQGHDYEHEALDLSPVRQRKVVVPEFDIIVGKQDSKGSPAADEGEEEGFLRTRKRLASRASQAAETILLGQGPTKKVKKDTLEKRKKKLPETEDWLFTGLSLPAPRIKKMDPPPPPPPPPPRASQTAMPPPEQYTLRNTTRWNSQPQSQATLMHPAAPRPSQTVTEAGTEVMMHVDTGFNTFKGLSQGGYIRIGKGRQGPPSSSSLDWERVTNAGNSPSTRGFNIKEYRALQAAQASQASQAPRVERASQASKDSRASQDFRALLGMDPRSREKRPVELFPPRALPVQHSQPSMPAAPETPSRDDEEQEEVGERLDDEDGDEDEDLPASFTHRYHEYSDPFGPGNPYQSNNPLDPRNRPRPPPPPSPMPALNLPRHVTEDAVSSPMRSTPPIFPSPPKPKSTAASTIEGLLRDVSEIAASSVAGPSQRLVPEPLRINTPSSPTSYVTHFVSRGIESDEMEFTNTELPDIEEEDEEVELPPLRNDTPRMVLLTAETDLPSAMSSNSELQQVEDTTEELEDLEMDLEKLFGKGSKKEFEKVLNMDEEWRRFLQPAAPEDSDAVEAQEDRISSDVMAVSEYQSEETNAATSGIEDSGFPDEKQMAVINDAIEQFIREYGSTQPPAIDQPMEQNLPVQTQAISNTLEEIIGLPANTGGQSEDPELLISSQTASLDPVLVANEKSVPTYKEQEPPTPAVPLSSSLSSPKLPATPPPVLPDQAPIIPDDPNQAWHDFIYGPSSSLDNSDDDLFSLPLPSVPKPPSRTFSSHFTALAAIEAPSSPNHRHLTLGHRFTAPTATEAPSSPNLSRQVRRGFTAINTPSSPPAYPRNAGRKFTTTEAPTSPDRNRNIGRRFTALTATEMPSSLPAHGARSRYFGGSDTPSGPSSRATRGSSPTMNETGHSFITPLREERAGRERRSITPQLPARVGGGKSFSTVGNVSAPTTPGTPGVASDLSSVSDPVEGSGRRMIRRWRRPKRFVGSMAEGDGEIEDAVVEDIEDW